MEINYELHSHFAPEKINLIAEWYFKEWKIPNAATVEKIRTLNENGREFQVLLSIDTKPVATGGIYNQVGLQAKLPRLSIFKHWMALVYCEPQSRGRGYASLLCEKIQAHSKSLGITELFLFTHTAENLYKRLGWEEMERIELEKKNIVIMKKELI
ncbi:GNAT family N-acetyltransferase [Flavihumibacter sp. UBA7668]|uniref:GNAT family N-acetyltransferase n=1 Tax=Flavihumibacter sp. UBA7668 TaxID=1946542 RepID=UPI0025C627AC|nr:GNAT family N-acetyltransferase [Flavihumibacter sp. UBA7668]